MSDRVAELEPEDLTTVPVGKARRVVFTALALVTFWFLAWRV